MVCWMKTWLNNKPPTGTDHLASRQTSDTGCTLTQNRRKNSSTPTEPAEPPGAARSRGSGHFPRDVRCFSLGAL